MICPRFDFTSPVELADLLFLSTKTIDFHRINIRRKLGLTNSKKTLSACLLNWKPSTILLQLLDEDLIFLDCSPSLSELFKTSGNFPIRKCLTDLFPKFAKNDLYSEYQLSRERVGYYERDNFALDDHPSALNIRL